MDLELKPGSIYGLLGRNGTGKSTLLRNMAGLLFPQQGRLDVLGFEPRKRQPAFLRQVFLLPEEFYLPPITIARWVRHTACFYPHFSFQQFHQYIAGFDIPAEGTMQEMSYGQQKKLLISFALAVNAPLLLMDEPTNGLDIISKGQFRKVIAGALDEKKCILISTHQVKDLENLIDRILVIEDGKILFEQDIETIAQKLTFSFSFDPEDLSRALYSESSFKGNALVLPNTDGDDSRPDLEMLYKAVILASEQINKAFKS
ncbi:ATP-binding cassette domain-containing protein [Flavitalea sp. BT771]|uniref:ABC transporter ATP-binding protein n=1 Tax=Flavitalea sp. BT771 TaxID=3063329 RepID=UPI0026E13589|nr:ATP-binding cassette domain-containing protein [Flavitalea sp. BT771]MDO6435378.1 ATP-binding cassette domain-containing protein [Flavitalea sp. BT771]MDV6224262.1 ATP-binding cassette domain-containing protein [Flavitalea sp. BT771]